MTISQVKVVRFHETGDASVLKIEQEPLQAPGDNEVRIKVEAIGLNRAEVMFRNGAYLEDPQFPSRLGYEASGIIDAVGTCQWMRRSQRDGTDNKGHRPQN